jgi:hypothetical protein
LPLVERALRTPKAAQCEAFVCAEEDSNPHPLSLNQALNLVTRVSYASLFLSLDVAAEQPDELATDVDDATEENLRSVSR